MKLLSGLLLMLLWVALGSAAARGEDSFGRLFHTPEERQRLDQHGGLESRPDPAASATPPPAGPLRLDGIVRRNDGRSIVWIGGRKATSSEARSQPDGDSATVTLPDGQQRRLRVGESALPEDVQ